MRYETHQSFLDLLDNTNPVYPEELNGIEDIMEAFFENDQSAQKHIIDDGLEGKAWIKDGVIHCKTSLGMHPTLTVPEHMTVLIDGKPFNGRTLVLSDEEKYETLTEVVIKETKWQLKMDADKLNVHLHVEPGYHLGYELPDAEPKKTLEPRLLEKKYVENTLQLDQIIKKMGLLRVKSGFHFAEMVKATESVEEKSFLVASGRPAQQGEHGRFELRVNTKVEKGYKENEKGRIDFREVKSIPLVEQGSLIGIVHPPIAGRIGYAVTNEPIPCERTYPLEVQAGKGVIRLHDKLIATENGRPQIERKGLLLKATIVQKLVHAGNVDLSSGNIKFKGDVEVHGEVLDHMIVEASGEVVIRKSINNATITTVRSVTGYSNCNGSKIMAGDKDFFEKELIIHSKTIISTIEQIFSHLAVITSSEAFKKSSSPIPIQPLISVLITKKFPGFLQSIKTFIDSLKKRDSLFITDEWKQICLGLERTFLSLAVEAKFQAGLQQVLNKMKTAVNDSCQTVSADSFITLPNAMNSNLFCQGDINITDKGCINTEIQAGGHVHIFGILRGGRAYADEGVTVGDAGSINSSQTIIEVPHRQTIRIGKALEGVLLKIGGYTYQFTEEVHNVKAYINKDDHITVEYERYQI